MNCCQWNRSNLCIKPESRTRGLAKGQLAIVIISLISGIRDRCDEPAFEFYGAIPTGVGVAPNRRIFVDFRRWGDDVPFTVAEIRA